MAYVFGTPEWAGALEREINESSEYRNAAVKWGVGFNGDMLFAFRPHGGLAEPVHLLIRLQGGSCQGAEFLDGARPSDVGFTLSAPFELWKEILERRTLAATAILTGKLRVDGEKVTLLKHTAANRALIHCTASVDTVWPD
jgi:putative sterol carrier protein